MSANRSTPQAAHGTPTTEATAANVDRWRQDVVASVGAGARLAGIYGTAENRGCRVGVLLATGSGFARLEVLLVPDVAGILQYPSLTPDVPAAGWYERALHDLFGVVPVGHPRLAPLLMAAAPGFQAPSPGLAQQPGRMRAREDAGVADISGRGVFTMPFGPVRSGVEESIEFLIETPGEAIPHLNIRPHYKHRGIAKAFEGRTIDDAVVVAERVEGIASVAHALAFCHAVETISRTAVPEPARWWRVVFAELERIANHMDVAQRLADTAGLASAAARFGWHKELVMRLVSGLCGSRFGRGVVVPGGVGSNISRESGFLAELDAIYRRIRRDADALLRTASFLDRVRTTGRLDPGLARAFGALGPLGRGSGFDDDDRRLRPYDGYAELDVPAACPEGLEGDALARLRVRFAEIDAARSLITAAATRLTQASGPTRVEISRASGTGLGWSEGPQGEELHSVELLDGRIRRCFARSASLHNLNLFHDVFHGEILTDFPFVEASFGLSYAGVAM